jgi:hypothetical protein
MRVRMFRFRLPFHIDASVSSVPLYALIAVCVVWMFCVVVGLGFRFVCSRIPWYAMACVMVANLAPCRSKSLGISRESGSSSGLFAPSLARRSLCSFPRVPLWPFTHWKSVVAMRCWSRNAAHLKKFAFCIPIHPRSSQVGRCVVRPFMAYMESDTIVSG